MNSTDNTLGEIIDEQPEQWAIVELFGHKRVAGRISQHEYGGSAFVRVDVPDGDAGYHTSLYGQGAIYCVRFVSELVARTAASRINDAPISAYDLPAPARAAMLRHEQGEDVADTDDDADIGELAF